MSVSIPAHVKKKLIDEIADLRTVFGLMANVPHQQFDWSVGKLWDIWRRELPTVPPPAGMPTPANYEEAQAALDVMLREIGEDAEGARTPPAGSTTTAEPDTGSGKPTEDQYVTRDQIAALVQRNKDTVAGWFNEDSQAPAPAVEGGGGKRHEYLWPKVRPWLEKKTGRKLPERFPELPPR
ncbi:MAG: hypothetical protein HYS12_01805 [Planctomycetes bacterium]|nr:hypothetical protein [Planctomycetota bacterium]